MTMVKHDGAKHLTPSRRVDLFDRFFDDWQSMFRRPVFLWPERGTEFMRADEYTEGDSLVVRVEIAGIDPEKDVEISIDDDTLCIDAQRREEESSRDRGYVRQELHYGSFHRELPLPKGTKDEDVKASYKDGILEVRVPAPKIEGHEAKKIPIAKS